MNYTALKLLKADKLQLEITVTSFAVLQASYKTQLMLREPQHWTTSEAHRPINSAVAKSAKHNYNQMFLQLVNSYCKPHLLYATECLQLSHTDIKKLKSAWLFALSKIFCVKGSNVDFITIVKCLSDIFLRRDCQQTKPILQEVTIMNSPLFNPFIALLV